MTDSFKPSLKIGTPLLGGTRQELRLQIETNRAVRVAVPLGEAATALMTVDQFKSAEIALRPLSDPENGNRRELGGPLPRGLGQPGDKLVGPNNDVGYIPIPITVANRIFVFNIWLRNFTVQQDKGSIAIELQAQPPGRNDPWPLLDRQPAVKEVPEPRVTSFSADRYYVRSGGGVTLNWTIEPVGNYELKSASGSAPLAIGQQQGNGQWSGNVRPGMQDFVLEAWAGAKPENPETRRLHIAIDSATHFDDYEFSSPNWPAGAGVLGLYADRKGGRLYALFRFGDSRYAELWYTDHGFDSAPDHWRKAARQDGTKPLIPVTTARRPGAIFNGKLFLIGGDCCSPNSAGSGLGYCDLNDKTGLYWQEVAANEAWSWPDDMNERMGHAVVALPGDKGLWVMGGWRQDGGVCSDVWQFDASANAPWKRVEGLRLPRCLFGATATPVALWTLGGFASPGGSPSDAAVRRCELDASARSWDNAEALPKIPDIGKDDQYCASVLFSREQGTADKPYGIAALWNVESNQPVRQYFYFEEKESWTSPAYLKTGKAPSDVLVQRRKWYHMQSAVFRDAVFFRTLTADESWAGKIITYLIFDPE